MYNSRFSSPQGLSRSINATTLIKYQVFNSNIPITTQHHKTTQFKLDNQTDTGDRHGYIEKVELCIRSPMMTTKVMF